MVNILHSLDSSFYDFILKSINSMNLWHKIFIFYLNYSIQILTYAVNGSFWKIKTFNNRQTEVFIYFFKGLKIVTMVQKGIIFITLKRWRITTMLPMTEGI